MKAWIIRKAGGPEHLQLEDVEVPSPRKGWALIRTRAFGLNRSEWFTRIGDSPTVRFPRVLGIECVGEIVDAGGLDLEPGTTVAAIMGRSLPHYPKCSRPLTARYMLDSKSIERNRY
jgi:NADPH:quinone reductase-like Zn-dependent oxidoreductase